MGVRDTELATVGRISKTFGLEGELVVSLYDTFEDTLTEGPVYVDIDAMPVPLFFKSLVRRGKSKAVAVFDDFETEYRATELVGREFYILCEPGENDGDDGEIYMENLVGYALKLEGVDAAGVVDGFVDSEHNPLFEATINGAEVLIPAADDLIISINQRKKVLTMRIPEGLLEL